MPVSIIGTFAVMLAIGYSANTVSLLALVLAIGIVVDDAIVVIENVERVIEEEPELSIPDATKKAMGEITAPIIAITLVLLSVFVPVAFIPGISGQLFRQFAVAVSVVDADLGDQRADAEPGAVLGAAEARRARARGPMRYVLGGIDRVRDGYVADRAPAGARRDLRRGRAWPAVLAASFGPVQDHAAGLPAGGGSGRLLRRHAAARGRLAQPHRGAGRRRSRSIIQPIPGVQGVLSVVGFNFIDGVASSNRPSSSSG